MRYAHIQVEPVAGSLGAEIAGVDLSKDLEQAAIDEIHAAWMAHQVLFYRDQSLTRDQHKVFVRRFGELHVHPVLQPLRDQGHPEIIVLESDAQRPFVAGSWHSDVTFQSQPPMGSVLRCVKMPEAGGDTLFASMYAAFDALSDSMQRVLSGLRAVHRGSFFRRVADERGEAELSKDEVSVHPVIRTHPVTGRKAIFVNSAFTESIEGMKPKESQALLSFVYEHLGSPEFTCRLRWRPGTLAMWDNRCTQHRVIADNLQALRSMERVTLCGDVPV